MSKRGQKGFERTRTQQQFADDVNINSIWRRAMNGIQPQGAPHPMQFIDVSEVPDLQTIMDASIRAKTLFATLPAQIRANFRNDPVNLYNFMKNPENREAAIRMGLLKKPETANESELIENEGSAEPANSGAESSAGGKKA